MTVAEARQIRIPSGYKIVGQNLGSVEPLLVRETPVVRGDELVDAQAGFAARTHEPTIAFRFNAAGSRKFANFTTNSVGRPFAVLLDDEVLSAPIIREAILGGSGQISGNLSPVRASQIAVQLRSGTLPAKLTVVEERVIDDRQ